MRRIGYIRRVANDDIPPNRIRELREEKGLSQAELARMANVTPSALNKLEAGLRRLDQVWMRRLAKLLDCSAADILPPSDNPSILTPAERALVERFRAADEGQQRNIERVTEALAPYRSERPDAA